VPVATRSSRNGDRSVADGDQLADLFPVWPRGRATAAALVALILAQAILLFAVTQRSFFFADDYNYFKLAAERHFLLYLVTPVLGVYPAPGDRLASFLLHELFPLNFTAARAILLIFLSGTTVLLRQLVGTLTRTDQWWTVALVAPFALSLTFVFPLSWWSAGLPIIPALSFTVVAFSAWLRSYTDPKPRVWLAVAVIALAGAGAFYIKFLLIPIYLLFFRLAILPRLMDLPGGLQQLWKERMRWIALAAPPAAFVAVYVFSGLAGRSASGGSRPYLEYFATAWFSALIPASFMNARLDGSAPSVAPWLIVLVSQALFWGVVGATWRRSSLALRGWALFVFAFAVNAAVVGTVRLPGFGVGIAYELRYYPEVVLFLPMALALCLRQGEERRPGLAWERTRLGGTAIAVTACLYAVAFVIWAPGIVSDSPGVPARAWYENLRRDMAAVMVHEPVPPLVDSETPDYVMPDWMAPDNRVSTILALADLDVVYNRSAGSTYLVQEDGHLAEAVFRPISLILSDTTPGEGVRILGGRSVISGGICLREGGRVLYRPRRDIADRRLAIRVFYARQSGRSLALKVVTGDPMRPFRHVDLRPFRSDAELVDLGTSRFRALALGPSTGGICIGRMEIGSLTAAG
jgi:hypothetical protein